MERNISWDDECECYTWEHEGNIMCLEAFNLVDARTEVDGYVADGIFPTKLMEHNEDDSMDGDFDSGMASAGFGTDEDYGCYGDDT